jgi:membrane-associated phospholipid phosphatase
MSHYPCSLAPLRLRSKSALPDMPASNQGSAAMNRKLLTTTILAALGCAVLVAVLFLFIDRPADWAAHGLKGTVWFQAAGGLSLLADHRLFNILLFAGFVLAGARALSGGLTPGLRKLLYCCLAVAIAMVLGATLKWFFGRYRPELLFSQGLYGFSFFADQGSRHSFPSGHTFRIFSAMTALALVWSKARIWLFSLAGLVGISRVLVCRHFPSDVLAGAFVGIFCALWVWRVMQGGERSANDILSPENRDHN